MSVRRQSADHALIRRARQLRRDMTGPERLIWYALRDRRLAGWKFPNTPSPRSDVLRRWSQATSPCDGTTACRCLCLRTGSGITEAWPHPERCPRQQPLGRNGPPAFTLCHRASGPCRALFALPSQWIQGREVEMTVQCQNRANCAGVYRCRNRIYDEKMPRSNGGVGGSKKLQNVYF